MTTLSQAPDIDQRTTTASGGTKDLSAVRRANIAASCQAGKTGSLADAIHDKPPAGAVHVASGSSRGTEDAAVVHASMWQVAADLRSDHEIGADGRCGRCDGSYPCAGRRLAAAGIDTAHGRINADSAYWIAYLRLLALPSTRSHRASVND